MTSLKEIIEQLKLCRFDCEGGALENNIAFIELKKLAIPQPGQQDILDLYYLDWQKFDKNIERYVEDFATFSKREKAETVEEIHDILVACSHPVRRSKP
jgi:rhamnose utilization protein RhaD (predicted bifunctional aldolase and dehydrogenase)